MRPAACHTGPIGKIADAATSDRAVYRNVHGDAGVVAVDTLFPIADGAPLTATPTASRALDAIGGRIVEDEILKRLLAAESKAEEIITLADRERTTLIEQAKRDAQAAERQQAQRAAEILSSFVAQAEQRAAQTVAELRRRYAERSESMKAAAELTKAQALDAALTLLIGAEKRRP